MEERYEKSMIGIDAVILSIFSGKLRVILNLREKEPFSGLLELPGGLLAKDETSEECLKRKLSEFFNHDVYFKQFNTFTNPQRDPRSRVVSIGFLAVVNYDKALKIRRPDYFAKDQNCWHPVNRILKSNTLSFDHKDILQKAVDDLRINCDYLFASKFLPEKFPLNKLQEVLEILLVKKFDNRNFRKQALKKYVINTNELEYDVTHRPAKLFIIKQQ
jgi:8-oxo-dGTP diphosphatase